MQTHELAELKRLAEMATPGEWAVMLGTYVVPAGHTDRKIGGATDPTTDFEEYAHQICTTRCAYLPNKANAAYIAATNPAAVLALLAALDGARFAADSHLKTMQSQARIIAGYQERAAAPAAPSERDAVLLAAVENIPRARWESTCMVAYKDGHWIQREAVLIAIRALATSAAPERSGKSAGDEPYSIVGFCDRITATKADSSSAAPSDSQRLADRLKSLGITKVNHFPGENPNATPDQIAAELLRALDHVAALAAPSPTGESLSDELAELRKLAEAATPGPWDTERLTDDECSFIGYSIHGADGKAISDDGTAPNSKDALYIAAANPAAILRLLTALATARQPAEAGNSGGLYPTFQHPDDSAVDRFAVAMKAKMASSRAKGRSGWDSEALCTVESLAAMLCLHVEKGDPVDIANFAMMIHERKGSAIDVYEALAVFLNSRMMGERHQFKNFHQNLCKRFGYTHDERDWKRDQCSLEEHIASLVTTPAAAQQVARQPEDKGPSAAIIREAEELAIILSGMVEGGDVGRDVDIYANSYGPADGDVYVVRAAMVLKELAALASTSAPKETAVQGVPEAEPVKHYTGGRFIRHITAPAGLVLSYGTGNGHAILAASPAPLQPQEPGK